MDEFRIRLTEELILLMLDESSGYLEMVPGWDFSCVMAGAVIADLALEDRIDTDLQSLYLLDATPTGDQLLDPTLEEISKAEDRSDTQYWIERNTARSEEIVTLTLQRLVDKGVLEYESGGFWTLSRSVSRSGMYPSADGSIRREAKARILNVVLNDDIPDPRDVILVGLMQTCDRFKTLLSEEDYDEKLERIETVASMDLVGRSVATAVKDSTVKPKSRPVLLTKPIPKLPVVDILRQRDLLAGNIPKATCRIFEKHGPVVRVPISMNGQPLVAVMGPECNNWVNKQGRFYLRSKDYIQGLEGVFGASRTLPGMDGAEHHKMRKSLRTA
ncbi:MAG: GPP34 family phosphoprotein, partial [Gammaproteobacteria bacterium]|nr:GPP34 family phosphoprotein [Gammaproteobacteria bacterium]